MKILFVQKVKAFAGSEKYFLNIIPALENRGFTMHLAIVVNKPDLPKCQSYINQIEANNISFTVILTRSDRTIFSTLNALKRVINNIKPTIVHSHLIHADFWCAVLKKRGRIKQHLVSTKHGYEEEFLAQHGFNGKIVPANRYYKMCKFSEKYIDKSFAVSEGLRQLFIDAGISPKNNITTIHHGFNLGEKPKLLSSKRTSEYQIVIIGRVLPFKGHHLALESFAKVVDKIPTAKCIIVGETDPDYKIQLDTIIDKHKLIGKVLFEGFQTNVYDYLLSSDVLLVPSISEGFGLVFLEGFNAETPIIGFDVSATNELISNNENGILIQPFDLEELADAVVHLLNNKAERQKLSLQGKKDLLQHFSLDRMVDDTVTFYTPLA